MTSFAVQNGSQQLILLFCSLLFLIRWVNCVLLILECKNILWKKRIFEKDIFQCNYGLKKLNELMLCNSPEQYYSWIDGCGNNRPWKTLVHEWFSTEHYRIWCYIVACIWSVWLDKWNLKTFSLVNEFLSPCHPLSLCPSYFLGQCLYTELRGSRVA